MHTFNSWFFMDMGIFKNTISNYQFEKFRLSYLTLVPDVMTVNLHHLVFCKAPMAEWSKAGHLSCSLFGGGGSNPPRCTLLVLISSLILDFSRIPTAISFLYEEDGDLTNSTWNSVRC